jgi:hypothetical protein
MVSPPVTSGRLLAVCLAVPLLASSAAAEVDFFSDVAAFSKWGTRDHGTPATVTWSFVDDGVAIDPSHPDAAQFSGGSMIGAMRSAFDASNGAGAFDAAIQNAFNTWQGLTDITFDGPITDSGLPVGHTGAPQVDIRIAAFTPVAGTLFAGSGAFGYGPPGDDEFFPNSYPVAGDILFNIAQPFVLKPGAEGDAVDPFGNDLEGLTLHELGHAAIGLGHPATGPGDLMYIGPGCCDFINRVPAQEEIGAARWIYGPSDFNGDSVVDAADYTVWRDRRGEIIASLDPNDPGYIAFVEDNYSRLYDRWQMNYGLEIGGPVIGPEDSAASAAVPQPASQLLALLLAPWAIPRRSRGLRDVAAKK